MATAGTALAEHALAPTRPVTGSGCRLRLVAAAAVVVFAAGFLLVGHHRLTMPFGDSHDGRNGAQWGLGSRALRTEGPLASHMGADLVAGPVRVPYTDHPPLIYSETALAETVAGEHPWVTRLPAWLGSIAAIGLCYRLLRRCGITPAPAAIGVVLGLGCPMFGAYGMMNDPWILGLPWGVAILLLWEERRAGVPRPAWLLAGVALIGALTSWVNVIELGLLAIAELVARLRRRRPDVLVPLAVGTGTGVALTVAWVAWAHGGSIRSLVDQAANRTSGGSDHVGPSLLISYLRSYWVDTFTPWQLVLGIPVLVAGWLRPRLRPLLAVTLMTVGLWVLVFADGAAHHDYWGYWLVLPLVVGFAAAADVVLAGRSARTLAVAVAGATAIGLVGLEVPRTIPRRLTQGAQAGSVLSAARQLVPPGQRYIWYLGDIVQTPYWIAYPFHRPAARLVNLRAVDELAAAQPDAIVLVAADRLTSDLRPGESSAPCRAGVPVHQNYKVLTAQALDEALHGRRCPAASAAGSGSPKTAPQGPQPEFIAP